MKNPEIEKIIAEYQSGAIALDEANKRLFDADCGFYLNPWKVEDVGYDQGVGLLDSGTGTLDRIRVIETHERIFTAEPVFDAEAFKHSPTPVFNVQYCGKWYRVAADGETLAEM